MLVRLLVTLFLLFSPAISQAKDVTTLNHEFGPFNSSYYDIFAVITPATINNEALQVTPDSAGNFSLKHKSGRVFYKHQFKLWEEGDEEGRVASFNSSFVINIFRLNTSGSTPGEGFAFLIAPDLNLPLASDGQYLGLTNSTTDGNSTNHLVAIELDFDPDDNQMGLDINSVRSNKTVTLSDLGIQIAPVDPKFYRLWVEYDGGNKVLEVYMTEDGKVKPVAPVLSADIDLKGIVKQYSYIGFSASTGTATQLNCVLKWNLTVEVLPENNSNSKRKKLVLAAGIPIMVLFLIVAAGLGYYLYNKSKAIKSDAHMLGTVLKTLPGTPREFRFRDLKKATNNFDEKLKLGQGGYGVVYKGVLPKENVEVAVKKFTRGNIKGEDDFLSELTIINRLHHKHLVHKKN